MSEVLDNIKGMVNIVKDKDYGTFFLICLTGIEWYSDNPKYATMSGSAVLLYRVIFKTTENKRKSKKFYKQWHAQILIRKDDKGHEIGLGPSAFLTYFPNGTEEQYNMVIAMLEADTALGIKRDNPQFPDVPYYIGKDGELKR